EGEERTGTRPLDRRVHRRARPRREPEVFRRGRCHHRPGLRHQPDRAGRLCAGARGADRDSRRANGRAADPSRGAAAVGLAGRAQVFGAEDRRAQRGAAEAAAGPGRVRQAEAGRSDQVTRDAPFRPRPPVWRSILYVPGNVPKFIDKAHERGADCVLVDLEDSVPPAQKPEARAMLAETMAKVARHGADVAVRINRPMRLAMPDTEAAVRPGLSALFVTKTESVQHLR